MEAVKNNKAGAVLIPIGITLYSNIPNSHTNALSLDSPHMLFDSTHFLDQFW